MVFNTKKVCVLLNFFLSDYPANLDGIQRRETGILPLSPCTLGSLLSPVDNPSLVMISKGTYLRQLTASTVQMRSAPMDKEIAGSSPPSVFIGSWNYPDVFAGPMVTAAHGNTSIMDTPESWIPENKTQEEIIGYRLNLIRGKQQVNAADLTTRFIGKLQDISLSDTSVESDVSFSSTPSGTTFSEEHTPFGPSAPLERFEIETGPWDRDLEKVFYDSDLKASDAVIDLHRKGLLFSSIQKAFSVGTMGCGKNRRLVPTRWAITACDTTIGDHLLTQVRKYPVIDTWRVHEFSSLHNNYAVILLPTTWQYEWSEAFLHVLNNEELVFSDHETGKKKTEYSSLGGCYYSCKMAVLEALAQEQKQAGAIVLREALHGYVPMGVFNVRENVRNAMKQPFVEFEDIRSALSHISRKFTLPVGRFIEEGDLLRNTIRMRQCTLRDFS
jgi:DNA repair protein NreA